MPYRFLKSQQNAAASEAATKEFWGGLERVFVGPGHKPMDREEIIAVMRTQRQVMRTQRQVLLSSLPYCPSDFHTPLYVPRPY